MYILYTRATERGFLGLRRGVDWTTAKDGDERMYPRRARQVANSSRSTRVRHSGTLHLPPVVAELVAHYDWSCRIRQ